MRAVPGPARERFPVVIVGAGQAGLAAGYHLARAHIHFIMLDAGRQIGDVWRRRWGSLRLFTPARIDGLPGMRFPASPRDHPSKEAMADYLETYVARFKLPVRLGVRVTALDALDGHFLLSASAAGQQQQVEADQVIVATGAHQTSRIPAFAADLAPEITQLSAGDYFSPSQLRPGGVLVVGAGNSGAEIALEVAQAHETWLSGRNTGTISSAIFTPPLWWVEMRFLTTATPVGRWVMGRLARRGAPLVRITRGDLTAAGIGLVARTVGVEGGKPRLEDGRVLDVRNVVWCTGFGRDFSWIHLPVFDAAGAPVHRRGVATAQPGLYFLGLPFLYGVTSGVVGGVGRDAECITRHVVNRSGSSFLRET
jgi:putative flavoprotein involved in K+ transport